MDIEKLRHTDKPLVFNWFTAWRPRQLEEADAAIGLPTARTRDQQLVRGYILGALINAARENPEQWVSYSRREGFYSNPARKRYWPVRNMYAAVVSSADQLDGIGLIDHQRMPPGNLHVQSRMRAKPELVRLFAEKNIALILAPPERILLRDRQGRLIEYRDTEQIRRMRRKLEVINEAGRAQTVSLNGRIIREGESVITPNTRIGASTLTMFRVFNRSFKLGGRFYGPWFQNIEKELRETIEINGSPTEEPDYQEHHLRLLYDARERLPPPEPFILDGWPRKTVKVAFYTLLNAESPIAARRAIAEHFGRGREANAKASKLIAEIERKHPAVSNQFGTGAGLWLMRKDSEITEYIMSEIIRGGDFALPIHGVPSPLGGGGPPPGWVAWLPPGPASLAVLSYFYAGASELDRAA